MLPRKLLACSLRLLLMIGAVNAAASLSLAQSKWEVTPYDVRVMVAVSPAAQLTADELATVKQQTERIVAARVGASWLTSTADAPPALHAEILLRLEDLSAAAAATQLGADADFDKAMLARLTAENGRLRITLRELDLATVQLSPPVTVSCANFAALPSALADAVIAAFSPLATLQAAEGDHVEARLRAASLIVATEHPTLAKQGTPLIPVLRPLDRLGRAKPELVSAIPWTVLEAETVNDGRLQCRIHSAHRKPLAGRPSQRIKRYAIAPAGPAWLARGTTLSLASVDAPNGPLVGYEIIEGNPEDDKTPVTVVGRTDGRGQVDVAASEAAWRMLYVRHGERLLARLPLIVGWRQEVTVPLASDDKRLEAEAFVTALRQDVIDTVARRQILAARIRRRIAEEKFDEAAELLRSMTQLTPFYEFDRRLQAAKATMASDQPRTQQLIDELFTKTESVLRRYLDPEDVARLQSQLAQARSGSQ